MTRLWVDTSSGTYGDAEFITFIDVEAVEMFDDLGDNERVDIAAGILGVGWATPVSHYFKEAE